MQVSTTALAARNSPTEAIIGNITRTLPNALARSNARNWVRNSSGMASETRIARHPRNGFSSGSKCM